MNKRTNELYRPLIMSGFELSLPWIRSLVPDDIHDIIGYGSSCTIIVDLKLKAYNMLCG